MSAVSDGDARQGLPPAPVLVTGAGGCVGAWVLHRLAAAGVAAVGFDLSDDRRRLALLCGSDAARAQTWETGDIADGARVLAVMRRHDIRAVIHLAALQVPFCKAAPADGARVNVVGSINVFEAARALGVRNVAYASSSSALAMVENSPWMETLYGAYKVCNEQTARVYWRDWEVASVGVRPAIIYGPGRDRGMSSKITLAMLAAVVGESCVVPFTGRTGFVYVEDAARVFIRAAALAGDGARIFDLTGDIQTVARVVELARAHRPNANVSCAGPAIALPADVPDDALRAFVGDCRWRTIDEGVAETMTIFENLAATGAISAADLRD